MRRAAWWAALAVAVAACGGGDDDGLVGDPCVDEPTASITFSQGSTTIQPGHQITVTWVIRTQRVSDGFESRAPGVATIEPGGVELENDEGHLSWSAPMEHGQYRVRVEREGCPADFATIDIDVVRPPQPPSIATTMGSLRAEQRILERGVWRADGSELAVIGEGVLLVYGADGTLRRGIGGPTVDEDVAALAWSPDGRFLSWAGLLLHADTLETITEWRGRGVAFDPGSGYHYAVDLDGIRRWNLSTGLIDVLAVFTPPRPTDWRPDVRFSPLGLLQVDNAYYHPATGLRTVELICPSETAPWERGRIRELASGAAWVMTRVELCSMQPASQTQVDRLSHGMSRHTDVEVDPDEQIVTTSGWVEGDSPYGLRAFRLGAGDPATVTGHMVGWSPPAGELPMSDGSAGLAPWVWFDLAWKPDGSELLMVGTWDQRDSGFGWALLSRADVLASIP